MNEWKHSPKNTNWSEHWSITVDSPDAKQNDHIPKHRYGVLIVYDKDLEAYVLWYRTRTTFHSRNNTSWTKHGQYKRLSNAQKQGLVIAVRMRLEGEL